MNSSKAIIGKNLVLIALVVVTLLTLFKGEFSVSDLLIMQAVLGVVYALLSYFEYNNTNYKAQLPIERFAYYPGSFFTLRAIKVGIYLTFALVLYYSPSHVKVLAPVCLIIALTEVVISVLKYRNKLCFVNIYANYILIALEDMEKVFASEIEYIEYRHDIFFLVKKNGGNTSIKTFSIANKEAFITKMKEWIQVNSVEVTNESMERLHAYKL